MPVSDRWTPSATLPTGPSELQRIVTKVSRNTHSLQAAKSDRFVSATCAEKRRSLLGNLRLSVSGFSDKRVDSLTRRVSWRFFGQTIRR